MLHIIFFLLKLIGIILISILGILILLILIVLFVPIRYQINAGNVDTIFAIGKVTWLFHLINFRITYLNKHFVMRLRILGKLFYDSDKPKEKVKKKIKRTAKKVGVRAEKQVDKTVQKQTEKQLIEKEKNPAATLEEKDKSIDSRVDPISESILEPKVELEPQQSDEQTEKVDSESDGTNTNSFKESDLFDKSLKNEKLSKLKNILQRIKLIPNNIKTFFLKVKNVFIKIKDTLIHIKDKLSGIQRLWINCRNFLQDEINKSAIKHIFISLKKFLKHIKPVKLSLNIEFGTGDPCSTGQALGGFAILYSFYGDAISIIPNFEEEIAEGTIFIRGRIRLFTLLIICIKLVLDKNFRIFIKNFKAFKEEL